MKGKGNEDRDNECKGPEVHVRDKMKTSLAGGERTGRLAGANNEVLPLSLSSHLHIG